MPLTAAAIAPHLRTCGYKLLRTDFPLSSEITVPLVAFSNEPEDARSACIAVLEKLHVTADDVAAIRGIGAPIIFSCEDGGLQWWKQTQASPERVAAIVPPANVPKFFATNNSEFEPTKIYRAKTWARYNQQYQLWFVDLGLMPLVEGEIGQRLVNLIVRNVDRLKTNLQWRVLNEAKSEWLLKVVFWLISAKILRDKSVGRFSNLDLLDVDLVFESVAEHFGTQGVEITTGTQRTALGELAEDIARFSSLELATTESLAYVYENALVSSATRRARGTHSTPAFLVDYIVGRLGNQIQAIDQDERSVFEPACGHGAFLVSAMRYLTELLPDSERTPTQRRSYLRKRIHGLDTDTFALEIARLSLSLTDIPNPNGWDVAPRDIFVGDTLEKKAAKATILLTNPPFESFTSEEKQWYQDRDVVLEQSNKSAEVLRRVLPALPTGAVVGLIMPQSFLHSKHATDVRRILLESFELQEVITLPDKVFEKADSEAAVILGTKKKSIPSGHSLYYARVREQDYGKFESTNRISFQQAIKQESFAQSDSGDMRSAEMADIWEFCSSLQVIGSLTEMGQGFQFKGESRLSRGTKTYQSERFPDAQRAFIHFDSNLLIHLLPTEYWANLDDDVIQCWRAGTTVGKPQVLLNYARASRSPWRLKALLDRKGHAVASRFIAIRPLNDDIPIEFLWALFNSPLSNAYAFTHCTQRDNLVGQMKRLPVPKHWQDHDEVVRGVRRYFELFEKGNRPEPGVAKKSLLNVEAEVLRLYDFPATLERQVLNLFNGVQRPGVTFQFDEYLPDSFVNDISLSDYVRITDEWPRVNRRRDALIRKKVGKTISSEEKGELDRLQLLASYRQRLIDPLPLVELERLSKELTRR